MKSQTRTVAKGSILFSLSTIRCFKFPLDIQLKFFCKQTNKPIICCVLVFPPRTMTVLSILSTKTLQKMQMLNCK